MPRSVQRSLPPMEVDRVHRDREPQTRVVNDVHRLDEIPLEMARAGVGACVREAIGVEPLKRFGHKGLVHSVCTGEKAPDYLARIYQDRAARRRFALALLNDDSEVIVTTVVTVPTKVR